MSYFAIELEEDEKSLAYLDAMDKKLTTVHYLNNRVFTGELIKLKDGLYLVRVLIQGAEWFMYTGIMGLLSATIIYGNLWNWWNIPSLIVFIVGWIASLGQGYVMKLGLRKKGYKGKVRLLNNDELIKTLLSE
jgi:hypothetical protein